MKHKIALFAMLLIMISLAACINIYNPAPTGTAQPTPTSSPASPSTPTSSPPITSLPPFTPPVLVPFEDRTWVLDALAKGNIALNAIPGKEVTARFDKSTGKVSGNAGCNTYGASYQRALNKITIGGVISTKMLCVGPDGIMQQENTFLDSLGDAESVRIGADKSGKEKLEIMCTLNRILIFTLK